jgi:hypothetical protein
LLAQAVQNDLNTAAEILDPPPVVRTIQDDDLKELFADLRCREKEWKDRTRAAV